MDEMFCLCVEIEKVRKVKITNRLAKKDKNLKITLRGSASTQL